jgi:hypothetical protein
MGNDKVFLANNRVSNFILMPYKDTCAATNWENWSTIIYRDGTKLDN